jgi:hypothetical protein
MARRARLLSTRLPPRNRPRPSHRPLPSRGSSSSRGRPPTPPHRPPRLPRETQVRLGGREAARPKPKRPPPHPHRRRQRPRLPLSRREVSSPAASSRARARPDRVGPVDRHPDQASGARGLRPMEPALAGAEGPVPQVSRGGAVVCPPPLSVSGRPRARAQGPALHH